MSGFDQWLGSGGGILPVWLAGAAAAFAVFVGALAFGRTAQAGPAGLAWRGALVLAGAGFGWAIADAAGGRNHSELRGVLDARAAELTLRALMPGSPLACLESVANSTVEDACARSLFAGPETVAAAIAYVDARMALLTAGLELAARDQRYAASIERQRRAIEDDRFGFVAHVLTTRGCSVERCEGLKLLRDPQRVIANLRDRGFEANVVLHSAAWQAGGASSAPPAIPSTSSAPAIAVAPGVATTGAAPSTGPIDYPTAASIPAISIMNAEPPLSPAESQAIGAALPAAKPQAPAVAPTQARRQSGREPSAASNLPLPPPGTQQVLPPQPAPPTQIAPPGAHNIPRWGGGN